MVEKMLLRAKNLKKYFPSREGILGGSKSFIHAVENISFYIQHGETFGLAGESGCGKSTVGRLLLRLIEPTGGRIFFDDIELSSLNKEELRKVRKNMGIIFQDPKSSLNPRMTVYDILRRPIEIHKIIKDDKEKLDGIINILERVGLGKEHIGRYPYEFSGGQLQRISIARAIITNPDFVVLDEPTSALDVSVQAQILNLLIELQKKCNLTYLFITHNLPVLQYISDRIAIMYLGEIVELENTNEIFEKKICHPYTASLLSSSPTPDPRRRGMEKIILKGDVSSPINPPPGCRFHPRCPFTKGICKKKKPNLFEIKNGHYVACHFPEKVSEEFGEYL